MSKKKKSEYEGKIVSEKLLAELSKKYGSVLRAGDDLKKMLGGSIKIPISPSHNANMDGGAREGTVIVLSGPAGSGKTSLAMEIGRNAQREEFGKRHVFLADIEARFEERTYKGIKDFNTDPEVFTHWTSMGLPMAGEDHLDAIEDIIRNKERCVIIIDSTSAMKARSELEGRLDGQRRNLMPKVLSDFFGRNAVPIRFNKHIVISIQHVVADLSMSRKTKSVTGGNKIQYHADNMLNITHVTDWLEGDKKIGQLIHWELTKAGGQAITGTKYTSALRYGHGIDCLYEIIEPCVEFGLIKVSGSWYESEYFPENEKGKKTIQGVAKVTDMLKENPEVVKNLEKELSEILS